MITSSKIKQIIRKILGEDLATWVHAVRFYFYNKKKDKEVEICLIPFLLKQGDVAIDIGANGADWTQALSKQVGANGKIFAFEADPYYAEVTRKTILISGLKNVMLFPFGLSDKSETVLLQIFNESNERMSGMGRVVREEKSKYFKNQCQLIKLEVRDDLIHLYPDLMKTKFIKCDVEGFELMVFRGSLKIIQEIRPIIVCEVGGGRYHGYSDSELFEFFYKMNYESYVLVSDKPELKRTFESGGGFDGKIPNRVMIPKEKKFQFIK